MNKSIEEYSDLIASFMKGNKFLDYQLSVHEDYNLMMNVLHKIENQGCIVEISMCLGMMCRITKGSFKKAIKSFMCEHTYLNNAIIGAIVEYINWYNENNKDE